MLDIVTTTFYIKAPEFKRQDFELYSTELFDKWDAYVEVTLNLPDYSLNLVVEEGSIKGRAAVAATAAALYFGIGNYGDFISGLQTIRDQANYVSEALFDQAKRSFGCGAARGNSKRSGGEIIYLEKLFERVQRGLTTPDEAIREVQSRWGEEASSAKLVEDLAKSLRDAPPYPEQLALLDDSWDACQDIEHLRRDPNPRTPRSPDAPMPQHYRIEIYRPSKGEKKKIKLTKVR